MLRDAGQILINAENCLTDNGKIPNDTTAEATTNTLDGVAQKINEV